MKLRALSLQDIREFLLIHQARLRFDQHISTISDLAGRAGISRQTIYAILRNERTEFGEVAQIRLSRVIQEIASDPSYQVSRMMRLDLSGAAPRIRFGV